VPTIHDGPIEQLDEVGCRRLLGSARVGRLSFTDGALPAILPVAFAVHDGSVFIPARRNTFLLSAVRGAVVALGVDSYRDAVGAGWSVTAVGPARAVRHPDAVAEVDALDLLPADGTTSGGDVAVKLALLRGWRTDGAGSIDR
jgi:nitroimidazol reductase NimA-like FMN-containing flavoprotein (pyridoxamine 5'-phosphate oxidase superfamily)